MRKPLTARDRQIIDMEIALQSAEKVRSIEVIRLRLRGEGAVKPVTHTPIYFERPVKDYTLPSLGMWKRWVESRQGAFMLHGILHILCMACGFPIPVSSGSKTVLKTRDKVTVNEGPDSKITIGAIVKWTEHETVFHNVFSQTLPTIEEEQEEKVVRLVTVKALGCIPCQLHYKRVEARELAQYHTQYSDHCNRFRALNTAIAAYRKACNDNGITVDESIISRYGVADPPKRPTPYILVDPKEIKLEYTVDYWKRAEQ